MSTSIVDLEVSDAQLTKYARLIYQTTGIVISPKKKKLLSNRLRRRLRATGMSDFDAYFRKLSKLPLTDPEWDAFLQEITTHETYLFRDEGQWNWFRDTFLSTVVSEARAGKRPKTLRVLSGACSTGDEAATMCTCIADKLGGTADWKIEVVGTDIGVEVVSQARTATFSKRAMKNVPATYVRRYFTKNENSEEWSLKPELKKWMRFKQHNLLDPLREAAFDIIFLKNVLIYFDQESKKVVLKNLQAVMRPGSVLVTGAAEGVGGLLNNMRRESPWRHVKPPSDLAETPK